MSMTPRKEMKLNLNSLENKKNKNYGINNFFLQKVLFWYLITISVA